MEGSSDSRVVYVLQRGGIFNLVRKPLVVINQPRRAVWPLLSDVYPNGKVVPVEVDLKGLQQAT
jgi:hypothetical protein